MRFKVLRLITIEEYCFLEADNAAQAAALADSQTVGIEWHAGKISDVELRDAHQVDKLGRRIDH